MCLFSVLGLTDIVQLPPRHVAPKDDVGDRDALADFQQGAGTAQQVFHALKFDLIKA